MASKNAPRAPRLTPLTLHDLVDNDDAFFGPGDTYDGQRFDRPSFDGVNLTSSDFLECELNGPLLNDAELRGVRFRGSVIKDSFAPIMKGARTSWRDTEVTSPRWGSAELYDSSWQSVRIDGGKIDFLNLRASKIIDLQISDCIIDELDLGGTHVTRLALQNCRIGTLDLQQATLKDVDLRTTDFRTLNGVGSMSGVVIDDYQMGLLAPIFAAHLGITVA
ncbi:pentapeptide repeat-containing protein [Specibacter sp. NPDC078709]|uniref:pentapeptide repeat-containing protein n=1 Tax=Specibacter sp. NPDC078709 TaxID=3154364 RepID=UPI00343294F6